jgi:hypothetical protein
MKLSVCEFWDVCEQIGSWFLPVLSEWVRCYLPQTVAGMVIAGMASLGRMPVASVCLILW